MFSALERGRFAYAGRCIFYGVGIVGSLLLYGLWQERIMSYPYDGEYFGASMFLVLCNRVVGMVFALVMALSMREETHCMAPLWKYTFISVTAVAASICQYEALKWVSFTVQMLGKSCKMLPVMLWGVALSGKAYLAVDWWTSVVVSVGVAIFLTGSLRSAGNDQESCLSGILFLIGFVALDALTSTFQEKLFQQHMTSKYNQMFYINAVSAVLTLATLLISGHTSESLNFCARHHAIIVDISLLSVVAVAAQWFIYSQVQEFGALVFAATMNVRQVVSIVASYLAYRHHITAAQIVSLVLIGAALFSRSAIGLLVEKAGEEQPILRSREGKVARILNSPFFRRTRVSCCPSWKV
uniref:Sugar phosphate transporter domain-containing protein n=1 Tax=Alexandrium monilatum TaxID=311494 RepID=A0A7S4VV73_9DINO|mmetsp:Transcript_79540/g.236934  ORF Transcript_79540/g.236934 Transcript_79540/m.236934 type:complete len:355 (-) Transcript_79540:114-1178(-)